MNEYFGPKWDAPVTDPPAQQIETPVGTDCEMCREPIQDGESGVAHEIWSGKVFTWSGEKKTYTHKECMLRSVMGSPSHIGGDCTPEGHAEDEKMTYREQALEVWRRVVVDKEVRL